MTEYQRQRKLLRDYLSRQRRKGKPVNVTLPKLVKNPTQKSVERLQKAREKAKEQARKQRQREKTKPRKTQQEPTPVTPSFPDDDYFVDSRTGEVRKRYRYEELDYDEGTFYVDPSTGELKHAIIDGHVVLPSENVARHILDTYAYSQFGGTFSPNKVALQGFFDTLTNEFGEDAVSDALRKASADGVQITKAILYSGEEAESYMDSILDYIDEAGEDTKESYRELFGDIEQWNTDEDRELFESRYRG